MPGERSWGPSRKSAAGPPPRSFRLPEADSDDGGLVQFRGGTIAELIAFLKAVVHRAIDFLKARSEWAPTDSLAERRTEESVAASSQPRPVGCRLEDRGCPTSARTCSRSVIQRPTSGPSVRAWWRRFDRTMSGSTKTGSSAARPRSRLKPRSILRPAARRGGRGRRHRGGSATETAGVYFAVAVQHVRELLSR